MNSSAQNNYIIKDWTSLIINKNNNEQLSTA